MRAVGGPSHSMLRDGCCRPGCTSSGTESVFAVIPRVGAASNLSAEGTWAAGSGAVGIGNVGRPGAASSVGNIAGGGSADIGAGGGKKSGSSGLTSALLGAGNAG